MLKTESLLRGILYPTGVLHPIGMACSGAPAVLSHWQGAVHGKHDLVMNEVVDLAGWMLGPSVNYTPHAAGDMRDAFSQLPLSKPYPFNLLNIYCASF